MKRSKGTVKAWFRIRRSCGPTRLIPRKGLFVENGYWVWNWFRLSFQFRVPRSKGWWIKEKSDAR